jgi:hypothetical protein
MEHNLFGSPVFAQKNVKPQNSRFVLKFVINFVVTVSRGESISTVGVAGFRRIPLAPGSWWRTSSQKSTRSDGGTFCGRRAYARKDQRFLHSGRGPGENILFCWGSLGFCCASAVLLLFFCCASAAPLPGFAGKRGPQKHSRSTAEAQQKHSRSTAETRGTTAEKYALAGPPA